MNADSGSHTGKSVQSSEMLLANGPWSACGRVPKVEPCGCGKAGNSLQVTLAQRQQQSHSSSRKQAWATDLPQRTCAGRCVEALAPEQLPVPAGYSCGAGYQAGDQGGALTLKGPSCQLWLWSLGARDGRLQGSL
jgi:hypothetical protein